MFFSPKQLLAIGKVPMIVYTVNCILLIQFITSSMRLCDARSKSKKMRQLQELFGHLHRIIYLWSSYSRIMGLLHVTRWANCLSCRQKRFYMICGLQKFKFKGTFHRDFRSPGFFSIETTCATDYRVKAGLGIRSFQKNVPFLPFFSVLYKRTFRSFRSL